MIITFNEWLITLYEEFNLYDFVTLLGIVELDTVISLTYALPRRKLIRSNYDCGGPEILFYLLPTG